MHHYFNIQNHKTLHSLHPMLFNDLVSHIIIITYGETFEFYASCTIQTIVTP